MSNKVLNILLRSVEIIAFASFFFFIDYLVLRFLYDGKVGKYDKWKYDFDVAMCMVMFIVFIAGYYFVIYSHKQYKSRWRKEGKELFRTNRNIMITRITGFSLVSIPLWIGITLATSEYALIIFVCLYIGFAPYIMYLGLSDAFSLKLALTIPIIMIIILSIPILLDIKISPAFAPIIAVVVSGLSIGKKYTFSLTRGYRESLLSTPKVNF